MRLFVSRRFGPWRIGASVGPEDWRRRRRGRPPKALANVASVRITPFVRPARTYYGVPVDSDPLIEPPPHVHHPGRDAWTIITTTVWLAVHAILWLAVIAVVTVAGLAVVMAVLVRALRHGTRPRARREADRHRHRRREATAGRSLRLSNPRSR
jgi:hypothetical protein